MGMKRLSISILVLAFMSISIFGAKAEPVAPATRSVLPVAEATRPVLVELFTSQGCANCPKANRFLAELAEDPNVITLSLAVDYWDYLGWKDTFAMSDFTARQKEYGEHLRARRPYTPQIIIDGETLIKGTRQAKIRRTINKLAETQAQGPQISLTRENGQMRLEIAAGLAPKNGAVILIADYMPGVQQIEIAAGENEGKVLDQVNMVTRLRPIGTWSGEAVSLIIAAADAGSCVAILQEAGPGRVLAVTKLEG